MSICMLYIHRFMFTHTRGTFSTMSTLIMCQRCLSTVHAAHMDWTPGVLPPPCRPHATWPGEEMAHKVAGSNRPTRTFYRSSSPVSHYETLYYTCTVLEAFKGLCDSENTLTASNNLGPIKRARTYQWRQCANFLAFLSSEISIEFTCFLLTSVHVWRRWWLMISNAIA